MNVSAVLETPTIPNLTNWMKTDARVGRGGGATLVLSGCDS